MSQVTKFRAQVTRFSCRFSFNNTYSKPILSKFNSLNKVNLNNAYEIFYYSHPIPIPNPISNRRYFSSQNSNNNGPLSPKDAIAKKTASFFDTVSLTENCSQNLDHDDLIRNFAIIAHVDHGKSTVCDRLLQYGGLNLSTQSSQQSNSQNKKQQAQSQSSNKQQFEQVLDTLEVEKQRGITIKAQTCSFIVDGEKRPSGTELKSQSQSQSQSQSESSLSLFEQSREFQQKIQYQSGIYRGQFLLNLIDTPGHIDFSYEVSRSLSCCQGVILLVDVLQGVQAQTVSTFYQAFCQDLIIIPAVNKVDLVKGYSDQDSEALKYISSVKDSMIDVLDDSWRREDILEISGKTGLNIDKVIDRIINDIPSPRESILRLKKSKSKQELLDSSMLKCKALIFDMFYDFGKGVVLCIYLESGEIRKRQKVRCHFAGQSQNQKSSTSTSSLIVHECGVLTPSMTVCTSLKSGQVGYISVNSKNIHDFRVGDTVFDSSDCRKTSVPFPGFQPLKPMVFAGVFSACPTESEKFEIAMRRYLLTDSSIEARPLTSQVMGGNGFRCGFLGLLHLDVFRQRLMQEYKMEVLITCPTIPYRIHLKGSGQQNQIGTSTSNSGVTVQQSSESSVPQSRILDLESVEDFPENPTTILKCEEPLVKATIVIPESMSHIVQKLCRERRGELLNMSTIGKHGVVGRDEEYGEVETKPTINDIKSRQESESHEVNLNLINENDNQIINSSNESTMKIDQYLDAESDSEDSITPSYQQSSSSRLLLEYSLPFSEIMQNFFETLLSQTHGYASFDYEFQDQTNSKFNNGSDSSSDNLNSQYSDNLNSSYREVKLVKVQIKLNDNLCEMLSFLSLEDNAKSHATKYLKKLSELIPPALFEIRMQAVINAKVIAKERIKCLKTDIVAQKILSHGHSGDPLRKKKLLDRQKEGKKKMREVSNVNVPSEAFIEMTKL